MDLIQNKAGCFLLISISFISDLIILIIIFGGWDCLLFSGLRNLEITSDSKNESPPLLIIPQSTFLKANPVRRCCAARVSHVYALVSTPGAMTSSQPAALSVALEWR